MKNRLTIVLNSFSLLIFLLSPIAIFSQAGLLDSSFNGTGISFQSTQWMIPSVAVFQSDGKLLISGFRSKDASTFGDDGMLLRYKSDGTPDNNFGTTGKVFTDFGTFTDRYFSIALQPDGRILTAGTLGDGTSTLQKGILARYEINGMPDSTFGKNGKVEQPYSTVPYSLRLYPLEILENKRILYLQHIYDTLNGKLRQRILKTMYRSNGTIDSSFGLDGTLEQQANSYPKAMDASGRNLFIDSTWINSLSYWKISRRYSNGNLDESFNSTGVNTIFMDSLGAYPAVCVIQPDKKVLIGGAVTKKLCESHGECLGKDFILLRLKENGSVDSSFGIFGKKTLNIDVSDEITALYAQADGKILAAGVVTNNPAGFEGPIALVRFLTDGKIDSSFGTHGKIILHQYPEAFLHQMLVKNKRIYLVNEANDINTSSRGVLIYAIKNDYANNGKTVLKLCPGTSQTILTSDVNGTSYQWQQSMDGTVFSNITNNNLFDGTTTASLSLKNIASSWSGYSFRCIANTDTSSAISIHFNNAWTGSVSNNWENAGNWSCGQVPDGQTDVVIYGSIVKVNSNVAIKSLSMKLGANITVSSGNTVLVSGVAVQQ